MALWCANRDIKTFWANSNFRFFEKKKIRFLKKIFSKNRKKFFKKIENFSWFKKVLFANWAPEDPEIAIFSFFRWLSSRNIKKPGNMQFGGLSVGKSVYNIFMDQLKFSSFWENKFSIFEKTFFRKSKKKFHKKSTNWVGPKRFYRPIGPSEDVQITNFSLLGSFYSRNQVKVF